MNRTLSNITRADLANAKKQEGASFDVLPEGKYTAKIIEFVEEASYNYVKVEINGKSYNFFYNYFLKDSTVFNEDVLAWIFALSKVPLTENTSLLEVTNSAIGSSYEIEIYNYTSKTGKNAGKKQHAIRFSTVPTPVTVDISTEEFELPY